jgi:hypothetical protein
MTWQDDVRSMARRARELVSDPARSDDERVAVLMAEFNIEEMEAWQHVEMASGTFPSCVTVIDR